MELYCLMCAHVWADPQTDHCPNCGCRDFMVNDDGQDWEDGHYEGDFPPRVTIDHGHGD